MGDPRQDTTVSVEGPVSKGGWVVVGRLRLNRHRYRRQPHHPWFPTVHTEMPSDAGLPSRSLGRGLGFGGGHGSVDPFPFERFLSFPFEREWEPGSIRFATRTIDEDAERSTGMVDDASDVARQATRETTHVPKQGVGRRRRTWLD